MAQDGLFYSDHKIQPWKVRGAAAHHFADQPLGKISADCAGLRAFRHNQPPTSPGEAVGPEKNPEVRAGPAVALSEDRRKIFRAMEPLRLVQWLFEKNLDRQPCPAFGPASADHRLSTARPHANEEAVSPFAPGC